MLYLFCPRAGLSRALNGEGSYHVGLHLSSPKEVLLQAADDMTKPAEIETT